MYALNVLYIYISLFHLSFFNLFNVSVSMDTQGLIVELGELGHD